MRFAAGWWLAGGRLQREVTGLHPKTGLHMKGWEKGSALSGTACQPHPTPLPPQWHPDCASRLHCGWRIEGRRAAESCCCQRQHNRPTHNALSVRRSV